MRGAAGRADALSAALSAALGTPVTGLVPVAGGDLNDAFQFLRGDSPPGFVKTSADAAPGAFAAEAAGLRWLADAGALRVPEVLAVGDDWLALEWIDNPKGGTVPSRAVPRFDEALGRGLALLHGAGAPAHGWTPDPPLRLGPLTLPAEPAPDAATFIAQQRWLPLARLADERGALPSGTHAAIDALAARAADLIPPEPPARLHGDLWSGNVMADTTGAPVLVDPAAHGGPREVDLAMLRLFGSPSPSFDAAYAEVHPLPDGHEDHVALHQLTPLLVHAVLFGGGYGSRVAAVARRYAARR